MFGEHIPRGDPCDCGLALSAHRPKHQPRGWPVCECGAPSIRHRVKHRFRWKTNITDSPLSADPGIRICDCGLPEQNHLTESIYRYEYVGIDGEGMGRNPHRYILLTAADENGKSWSLENAKGIDTEAALYWIVSTLKDSRVFSFSFGYDITCILKDLPNKLLYSLLRPSLRYVRGKLRPVRWRGFTIDWLQGRLTIKGKTGRVVIWDLFKFYQCSFVKALENWGIDTLNIDAMKQRRGKFRASEMPKIRDYCKDECVQLAKLARKLVETHRKCDLTLKSYYGPGSTASVAISKMGAIDYRGEQPPAMRVPIACGFFGGRFEHSVMGPVSEVWGYDISSAYPYQLYQLPCLECGTWEHVTKGVRRAIKDSTTALVRYRYEGRARNVWAPFPHRSASGAICYPYRSTGWLWKPEILAGIESRLGAVTLLEAWVYRTECQHRPFEQIAEYYRRRTEIGKDAAGIVLKLACNSCYGKLAQSKGRSPKYQCWPWAGLITSGCRAQLLNLLSSASSGRHILAMATDGLYSRERLTPPRPIDTGTGDLAKPLGGWEEKHYPEGMLFVKPGIYTSLAPDGDVRARGIGRKSLSVSKIALIETWQAGGRSFTITVDRFYGAKTTIGPKLKRSPRYGQWSKMPIRIQFSCPNRSATMGLPSTDTPSVPYNPVIMTPEKREAIMTEAIEYEQP